MKVEYQLQGIFRRTLSSGTETSPVSLVELLQDVQGAATENRRCSLQLLHQSFGLDFLPEATLINLLKQARDIAEESELYQIPLLKLLHPVKSNLNSQVTKTYLYQFCCSEVEVPFNLTPDDPQIPYFAGSESEKTGNYTVILEKPFHPDLSDIFANNIWYQSHKYWEQLPDIDKIHFVQKSAKKKNFRISIPDNPNLNICFSIQDLSLDLKAVITFLSLNYGDISILPEAAQLLVEKYQSSYKSPIIINLPNQLQTDSNLTTQSEFLISRAENRSRLKTIISEASQFLLISSYIIEDEHLTELVCEKSQILSQGVWILTDLRNEVIDRIDTQVADTIAVPQQYQRSDERKIACLKKLLQQPNIYIRSGSFHLKIYLSEKHAYLGSCNLTGGSLDFNIEAGIVCQNSPVHQQLITLFRQFWEYKSQDEVIAASNFDGFVLSSLHSNHHRNNQNYSNLLTPYQYHRDLIREISNFRGIVQIYSRSFQPSSEIEQYLRQLDTQIYIDSQISMHHNNWNIQRINNLHAKITLLGDKVAYIGGINFNFKPRALSLNDLMYKTTNPTEIYQIRQQITQLNPNTFQLLHR